MHEFFGGADDDSKQTIDARAEENETDRRTRLINVNEFAECTTSVIVEEAFANKFPLNGDVTVRNQVSLPMPASSTRAAHSQFNRMQSVQINACGRKQKGIEQNVRILKFNFLFRSAKCDDIISLMN